MISGGGGPRSVADVVLAWAVETALECEDDGLGIEVVDVMVHHEGLPAIEVVGVFGSGAQTAVSPP